MATLRAPVDPQRDHIFGDASAPAVLVEYGDYECPHCAAAHPIVQQVQKHFGARLAFVYRNFPLTQIHPNAEAAAETAEYAAAHRDFWPMHDALFDHQDDLEPQALLELAQEQGLSPEDLAAALEEGRFTPRIQADFTSGVRSGVNGTPTFFINSHRHDAPFDFNNLAAAIEAQLK